MKKTTLVLLTFVFAAMIPTAGWSASPWTEKGTWGEKAAAKLDFGIKNLFGGFTELITEPWAVRKNGASEIASGVGRGVWHFAADTIGGALHVITFPIVDLDVPLPENGVDFSGSETK